jgi:hypothetical protein
MTKTNLSAAVLVIVCAFVTTACGKKPDQLRTVTSYEMSSCNSEPTREQTESDAADRFRFRVVEGYFARDEDGLYAANREDTAAASALRQYRGPFYTYIHPIKLSDEERAQGIEWSGMIYLHAESVRTRPNGHDWGEWQRVRTRNFADSGRTADGLGRWKCLLNAEIAWARVNKLKGIFIVEPEAAGVYDGAELKRLLPVPAKDEISGTVIVAPYKG